MNLLTRIRSLFKREPESKRESGFVLEGIPAFANYEEARRDRLKDRIPPESNIASSLNRLDEHGRSQIGRLVTRETVHVPGSMPYVFIISIEDLPSDTITREGAA